MDKAYLVYNRSEARGSDDNAGYWSNIEGWTKIDRATVFFEEDRRRAAALPPGAVTVEAPAMRWSEERRAAWAERLEAGRVVYVHDTSAAFNLPSAQLPGLDGHYIVEGRAGGNLLLRGALGSRVEVPVAMVHPSPFDAPLQLLRERVQLPPEVVDIHYVDGSPDLRAWVENDALPDDLIGPATVHEVRELATCLAIAHPPIEWPLPLRKGDLVTWADPDDGTASCLAIALQGEDDCDDTCRILPCGSNTELEVPLHELASAPQTRALHALRNGLVQELPAAVFDALHFALDPSLEALCDLSTARIRITGLRDLEPAERAHVEARIRARGFAVEVGGKDALCARAAIASPVIYDAEAFDEAWGLIRPACGGVFGHADAEDANAPTVWSVVASEAGSLWLSAGIQTTNVLGFLRTRRPWISGAERVLLGADQRCEARPVFAGVPNF